MGEIFGGGGDWYAEGAKGAEDAERVSRVYGFLVRWGLEGWLRFVLLRSSRRRRARMGGTGSVTGGVRACRGLGRHMDDTRQML